MISATATQQLADVRMGHLTLLARLLHSHIHCRVAVAFLTERSLSGPVRIAARAKAGTEEDSTLPDDARLLAQIQSAPAGAPVQLVGPAGDTHVVAIGFDEGHGLKGGAVVHLSVPPQEDTLRQLTTVAELAMCLLSSLNGKTEVMLASPDTAFRDQLADIVGIYADAYWEAGSDGIIRRIQIIGNPDSAGDLLLLEGKSLHSLMGVDSPPRPDSAKEIRAFRCSVPLLQREEFTTVLSARFLGDERGWAGLARLVSPDEINAWTGKQDRKLMAMVETAREREEELRHNTDIILEGLRVLTGGATKQSMFSQLFETLAPGLKFDAAVVLQQDWSGEIAAIAATDEKTLAVDWSSSQKLFESDEVATLHDLSASPCVPAEPFRRLGWRRLLAIRLAGGAKMSVLLCFYNGGEVGNRQIDLGMRFGLVASQALMNEEERQKVVQASKLAAVGELSAGIVHEINQPLGAMTLAIENLKLASQSGVLTVETLNAKLDRLSDYLGRAGKIVGSIRKLAHTSAAVKEVFDLKEAVEEAETIVHHKVAGAGIALSVLIGEGLLVGGDRLEFTQVIINFLSNSVDAITTARSSRPSQSGEDFIEISAATDGGWISLLVRDTGCGFSDAALAQVFTPFFTTKKAGQGMGLGLSICSQIIQNMAGELSVGNWSRGAEINLRLRAATPEISSASAQKA